MIPKKKKGEELCPEKIGSSFIEPEQRNGGGGGDWGIVGRRGLMRHMVGENWERAKPLECKHRI